MKLLDHVHEWYKKWQLNLNIDKTQIVHFRKSQKQRTKFEFKIGLDKVTVGSKYKYLGTFLDEFLTFSENAQILADSAGRGLGSVLSKFKQFKDCGYRTYEKMYNTSVVPILVMGQEYGGLIKMGQQKKIYNRELRYFLCVNKFTANLFLQGDSGWLPPKYLFYLSALRYWNKLCQFDNTHIPKQIFNWTFQFKKHYTWVKNIQKVFDLLNMSSYFLERRKVDLNFCENILRKNLQESWAISVGNKPKLRTYEKIKTNISTDEYLLLPKYQRSLIARLRSGTLSLAIETGRFTNVHLENRTCILCNNKEIEDEIHFLCVCPQLELIRQKYYET